MPIRLWIRKRSRGWCGISRIAKVGAVAGNVKVMNRNKWLTRWQALEYITSQNLEKRAFDLLNCIPVVPGAAGAWRTDLLRANGGFSGDTVAEDTRPHPDHSPQRGGRFCTTKMPSGARKSRTPWKL
jgi:cellulose synthase/poly-beta-1,6-N-acetylglucosamine synthase-like glycosyltransferase